ncbi:helix-turn-helix domain-containing protein [Anaerosphaera multitolerans]|uniref:XRE family transcriptional regulator n=1 Tax=Anaerosphaera multitolerans TaxID=2487351 RepID=A0A437S6E7_9FIRM|nr:helix-turn-helix transcriptional regulator [Anaerosphaera multitolerans]RVU54571.1 XRE family transcriptional regulator [Anaerosphaera multitolerans]
MKINEIIKSKRKELGYTQEEIADILGISTPAVNKWESGATYPDITLLPPLARLLKTDLNTLLSFKEDLSNEEIETILNKTFEIINKESFSAGFNYAIDIINDYPHNEVLTLNLALVLDGALTLFLVENQKEYKKKLESLYKKLVESENYTVKNEAIHMLISKYMEENKYEKVEELINLLPTPSPRNKNFYLTNLYFQKNNFDEALKLLSSELIQSLSDTQNILFMMVKIALKENRPEDAKLYANSYKKLNDDFGFLKFISYTAHLEIALYNKDKESALLILEKMLNSLEENWNVGNSIFYKFLNSSKDNLDNYISKFIPAILKGFETEEEYDFLREDERFLEMISNNKIKFKIDNEKEL